MAFYQKYINQDYVLDYLETNLNTISYKFENNRELSQGIKDEYKKPFNLNNTDSISKDKISKYYSIYQGNKSLFDNNDQLLNLYELVESKKFNFIRDFLNKDIKNAKIITFMKNQALLTMTLAL